MIFDIEVNPLTQEVSILPIDKDGFSLYDLLQKSGLHKNARIVCFYGYEDAVFFKGETHGMG